MRSCNAHPRCRHHPSANADAAHWCFWEAAANRFERSALSRRNQSCCKSAWVRVKGRTKWPVCDGGEAAAAKWTHAVTGGGGWIFNCTQYKSVDHSLLQFRSLKKINKYRKNLLCWRRKDDSTPGLVLPLRMRRRGDAQPSVRPCAKLSPTADPGACSMFARLRGASCDPTWRRSARRRMSRKTCTDRRLRCPASRNQR